MPAPLSAKRSSLRLIQGLKEDVSFDDIIYELYVLQKVEQGMEDVREGRTVPHDEVMREVESWRA